MLFSRHSVLAFVSGGPSFSLAPPPFGTRQSRQNDVSRSLSLIPLSVGPFPPLSFSSSFPQIRSIPLSVHSNACLLYSSPSLPPFLLSTCIHPQPTNWITHARPSKHTERERGGGETKAGWLSASTQNLQSPPPSSCLRLVIFHITALFFVIKRKFSTFPDSLRRQESRGKLFFTSFFPLSLFFGFRSRISRCCCPLDRSKLF